jgi:hypothetical protein
MSEKADCVTRKLYNILDLKNSTMVSFHEKMRTQFNQITRRETERANKVADEMHSLNFEMRDMAKQTSKDAISMKIITLVAMIYLPISFIAVSLNTLLCGYTSTWYKLTFSYLVDHSEFRNHFF